MTNRQFFTCTFCLKPKITNFVMVVHAALEQDRDILSCPSITQPKDVMDERSGWS